MKTPTLKDLKPLAVIYRVDLENGDHVVVKKMICGPNEDHHYDLRTEFIYYEEHICERLRTMTAAVSRDFIDEDTNIRSMEQIMYYLESDRFISECDRAKLTLSKIEVKGAKSCQLKKL